MSDNPAHTPTPDLTKVIKDMKEITLKDNALYQEIVALREEIGEIDFDVVAAIREMRGHPPDGPSREALLELYQAAKERSPRSITRAVARCRESEGK